MFCGISLKIREGLYAVLVHLDPGGCQHIDGMYQDGLAFEGVPKIETHLAHQVLYVKRLGSQQEGVAVRGLHIGIIRAHHAAFTPGTHDRDAMVKGSFAGSGGI